MSSMTSCGVGNYCCPVRKGRTWRKRKRKCANVEDFNYYVDCSPTLINLSKWLQRRFSRTSLKPRLKAAFFHTTGRGLLSVTGLKAGDIVIQIPREAMVTCSDVFSVGKLQLSFNYLKIRLRAMEVLAIFLLYHRWLGVHSEWKYYIDSLPATYTVPAFCSEEEINVMPEFLKNIVHGQKDDLQKCYKNTLEIFRDLSVKKNCSYIPSMTDIRWAWYTVNTRAVYMKNSFPNPLLIDEDIYALAPYLDLLNHSHEAQVETGFCEISKFYQIKTMVPYGRRDQVFINYGPHDNIKLYREYGFILKSNPHNSVPFVLDELLVIIKDFELKEDVLVQNRKVLLYEKQKIIMSQNIYKNFAISSEGPSWNSEVAATILLMTAGELSQWQVVYQNLKGVVHRHLVLQCLKKLCKRKLDSLKLALMNMENLGECTDAFTCGKLLVKDCCSVLIDAEELI